MSNSSRRDTNTHYAAWRNPEAPAWPNVYYSSGQITDGRGLDVAAARPLSCWVMDYLILRFWRRWLVLGHLKHVIYVGNVANPVSE
jgi:hypothetical protein